jgi:filamentous hemagglutinin
MNEIGQKYSPGSIIADVPSTPRDLVGRKLEGIKVLEIPVQTKTIPQGVLDWAAKNKVTLRDINGRVYE